jgi:hypothetical protein
MKWRIFLALIVIASFSSCIIFTFHPLYSDDILTDIPGLEGAFLDYESSTNDSSEWKFTWEGKGTYSLVIAQNGHSGKMEVHAVKLGGEYFLDFLADGLDSENIPDFIEWHLVPMHSFAKVNVNEDGIDMWFIDMEWAEENLENHRIRIDHETRKKNDDTEFILLTASTKELQKFVAKYARFGEAFDDPDELKRITAQ